MHTSFSDSAILAKLISEPSPGSNRSILVAKDEELRAAYQCIEKLKADLLECRDFIEPFVDVVDGADGQPAPNAAMRLVSTIDESLHGPGGF